MKNERCIDRMKSGAIKGAEIGALVFIAATLVIGIVKHEEISRAFFTNPTELIESYALMLSIYITTLAGMGAVVKGIQGNLIEEKSN